MIKTNFVKERRFLSNEHFPIVPGIENVIWAPLCSQKPIVLDVYFASKGLIT